MVYDINFIIIMSANIDLLLPEKPSEPLESECCGTGCNPCVFDIYKKQILKWEKECQEILINGVRSSTENGRNLEEAFLSPLEYKEHKVLEVFADSNSSSKILRFKCLHECNDFSNAPSCISRFPVKIGQHIVFRTKDETIARKYTVLKIEKELEASLHSPNYFDVLVKIYPTGPMTQFLDKLTKGDTLPIRGPFGTEFLYQPNQYAMIVMLAAGTGIAPMHRIIETVLQNEDDETRIRLLYSNKNLNSVLLKSEFKCWSSFWNFQAEHYLSEEEESTQVNIPYGMKVHFERITFDVIENFCKDKLSSSSLYLICGTNSFEKDMINYLQRLGVESNSIHVF